MSVLKLGSTGDLVTELQQKLQEQGLDPGPVNGTFGTATQAAVKEFQRREGLSDDGVVGARTALALGLSSEPEIAPVIPGVTLKAVAKMFPVTPLQNIRVNLPIVLEALLGPQLADKQMILMALATIRAETESFEPISEGQSNNNTSPGGQPFDKYDHILGNQGPPDGRMFCGRGFVQLTGRENYQQHGRAIGLGDQLIDNPALANDPEIAARLLASFLGSRAQRIRAALQADDLAEARRLVNGGSNGLDRFEEAYQTGNAMLPETASAQPA